MSVSHGSDMRTGVLTPATMRVLSAFRIRQQYRPRPHGLAGGDARAPTQPAPHPSTAEESAFSVWNGNSPGAQGRGLQMRVSPRLLTLTMAVVLTAFLLMLIGWLLQEPHPLQVRQLPDGTVLRLEAVTHGPQQRFVRGRNWQRLLAPLLSPSLQPMPPG